MISKNYIFTIQSEREFEGKALDIFKFQAYRNPVYREYIHHSGVFPEEVKHLEDIPFLPIEFFKSHQVVSFEGEAECVFTSSGTSGVDFSRHYVREVSLYEHSINKSFKRFYGPLSDYCILALLPSYRERKGSSLVYMVDKWIEKTENRKSGYFLHNYKDLYKRLLGLEEEGQKTLLIGVSYALLDFVEKYSLPLKHTLVMETGGMKGRRREMTREELHGIIQEKLGVKVIHSEYGMTEILSQAYSKGEGKFFAPSWMKLMIRDTYDPYTYMPVEKSGGINIIDLANYYSCSFIETQDIGKLHTDGSFEVLGRMDNSAIRGCNLMIE